MDQYMKTQTNYWMSGRYQDKNCPFFVHFRPIWLWEFYTGQVARDTDKKELKLCTLAFFTALIDTVFGDEVQCVCYDHPEILLKDSLKRQINYNLNPRGTVTMCFQVPL